MESISLNSFVSSAKEAILKFRQTNPQHTADIAVRTSPDEHLKFLQVKMDLSQAGISLWSYDTPSSPIVAGRLSIRISLHLVESL